MKNLFGIIRSMNSTLLYDIQVDKECNIPPDSVPNSFTDVDLMYWDAMTCDYDVMCVAMHERENAKTPEQIKMYHEWIALYMHGMSLTEEERDYRQTLAKRMNEDG